MAPPLRRSAARRPSQAARRTSPATRRTSTTPTGGSPGPGASCRTRRTCPPSSPRPRPTRSRSCWSRPRPRRGPRITPGRVFPGWNVGNPLRQGWNGTRGLSERISFTNRYGALLHGTVYRPKPGARDPYTGQVLSGPFPGVVITEGSVQGSEGMYRWLAQDLAERGYVVLTYDVQGQGGGETLPHEPVPGSESNALPFCNPFAPPQAGEAVRLPRRSRPAAVELRGRHRGRAVVLHLHAVAALRQPAFGGREGERPQPLLAAVRPHRPTAAHGDPGSHHEDRDHRPLDGRRGGLEGAGHRPTGRRGRRARQARPGPSGAGPLDGSGNKPVVPALALQSEYGFTVAPYLLSGGSSLTPAAHPGRAGPAA